jgi:hypothetical protein
LWKTSLSRDAAKVVDVRLKRLVIHLLAFLAPG